MGFNQKEIDIAIESATARTFKATLENQSIRFYRTPATIPHHIRPKVAAVLESCADYYERTIFMGEYEPRQGEPPFPEFTNTLDDINFKLSDLRL